MFLELEKTVLSESFLQTQSTDQIIVLQPWFLWLQICMRNHTARFHKTASFNIKNRIN